MTQHVTGEIHNGHRTVFGENTQLKGSVMSWRHYQGHPVILLLSSHASNMIDWADLITGRKGGAGKETSEEDRTFSVILAKKTNGHVVSKWLCEVILFKRRM